MTLEIMKLAVEAFSTVSAKPDIQRFFHKTTNIVTGPSTLEIPAQDFFNDTGAAVTLLPAITSDNGYFQVYMNGILQMNGLSTYIPGKVNEGKLSITIPDGSNILHGTIIVLEILNFVPTATTVINT